MTQPDWRDEEWRDNALCQQVDPDLFFPEKSEQGNEAKAVCALCPSVADCLEFALQTGQTAGIWGGKGERERRKIRAQRGLTGPPKRVPAVRVYELADLGWAVPAIAAEVGCHTDSVKRLLKLRLQSGAAA